MTSTTLRDPSTLLRLGAAFLLVASLLRFVHPGDVRSQDVLDGVSGLAFGLAIGFMLWSALERRRLRRA